jgi:hypothetical protein
MIEASGWPRLEVATGEQVENRNTKALKQEQLPRRKRLARHFITARNMRQKAARFASLGVDVPGGSH